MVFLYDMLFGKGIQCGGPVKRTMNRHKVDILKSLEGAKERMKSSLHLFQQGTCDLYIHTKDPQIF